MKRLRRLGKSMLWWCGFTITSITSRRRSSCWEQSEPDRKLLASGFWKFSVYRRSDRSAGKAGGNLVAVLDFPRVLEQFAIDVKNQGVAAIQDRQWRERFQLREHVLQPQSFGQKEIPHRGTHGRCLTREFFTDSRQHTAQVVVPHRSRENFKLAPLRFQ